MICLDNTDVIEGGASVDAVIDYQIHGLVGTTFTQLAAGVMNTTLTAVLYTAGAAISVVSIILVNKHTSAVDITLCLDPANGGVPRYIIPKTISLGAGYSLHTDGARLTIIDASGGLVTGVNVSDTAYAAGWNGETKIAPSKNAVYDKIQTILGDVTAAANITDNAVVAGDGGAKGVQGRTMLISDAGEMTNPSQPAFSVYMTTTQTNIALDSNVTVVFDLERFDQGNNFASNTFTAPKTGKYQINVALQIDQIDTAGSYYTFQLITSNKTYTFSMDVTKYSGDLVYYPITLSLLVGMDTNDTACVTVKQSAGTQQSDINSASSFSGFLAC